MRTIIAGSRDITDAALVERAIQESGFRITVAVSGTAQGVDTLGEEWAARNSVPVARFPADWNGLGLHAGSVRNGQMAADAEALIAIWDGVSAGTRDMIQQAKKKGLKVFVYRADR